MQYPFHIGRLSFKTNEYINYRNNTIIFSGECSLYNKGRSKKLASLVKTVPAPYISDCLPSDCIDIYYNSNIIVFLNNPSVPKLSLNLASDRLGSPNTVKSPKS